jgi:hypothetical protein
MVPSPIQIGGFTRKGPPGGRAKRGRRRRSFIFGGGIEEGPGTFRAGRRDPRGDGVEFFGARASRVDGRRLWSRRKRPGGIITSSKDCQSLAMLAEPRAFPFLGGGNVWGAPCPTPVHSMSFGRPRSVIISVSVAVSVIESTAMHGVQNNASNSRSLAGGMEGGRKERAGALLVHS